MEREMGQTPAFRAQKGSFWITSGLSKRDSDSHSPVQHKTSAPQAPLQSLAKAFAMLKDSVCPSS